VLISKVQYISVMHYVERVEQNEKNINQINPTMESTEVRREVTSRWSRRWPDKKGNPMKKEIDY